MEQIRILHEDVIMDPGGIEALLMNVYRHIDRDKIQFDFMVHRDTPGFYEKEITELGGRIYRTPKFSPFPGQYQKYIKSVHNIISQHPEYKIIHAHADLNLWPLMVAAKLGVPVRIAHAHNAKTVLNLKYFFFKYEKFQLGKYCTDYFACSKPAADFRYEKKYANNAIIIKNGIETEKYKFSNEIRNTVRSELGIEDKFVVGHVGRFDYPKNHSFLIEVFSEILKLKSDALLVLVGENQTTLEKVKEKIKKYRLENNVMFLGFRSDVNRILMAMDAFVFPSLWEGLPTSCIEAQASGLPMVISDAITDEVCITDLVKKMSLEEDPQEWAKTVINNYGNLHNREEYQQLVVESGFDIKNVAKWLETFYIDKYMEAKAND